MIRHSLRRVIGSLHVSAVVIVTLAIGVGASATLLGVFSALAWRPIHLPQSSALVRIWTNYPARKLQTINLSSQKYRMIAERVTAFDSVGASTAGTSVMTEKGSQPARLTSLSVTRSYLPTLGLSLRLGRNFEAAEDIEHGPAVCILSHEFWRTRFAGRDDVVGQAIELDGVPTTVVGVVAEPMPLPLSGVDVLRPWPLTPAGLTLQQIEGGAGFLQVTGRLRPGKTMADANTEIAAVDAQYGQAFPGRLDAKGFNYVRQWSEEFTGPMNQPIRLLMLAVALVLLLAVANVSHVLLARASERRNESAVRVALGASRLQVAMPLVLEAVWLAVGASLVACLVAWGLDRLAVVYLTDQLRIPVDLDLGVAALAWIFGLCLVATMAVSAAPVAHAMRTDALRAVGRTRGVTASAAGRRFRDGVLVVESMFSVALLIIAATMLSSVQALQAVTPGFDARGVANVEVDASALSFADAAAQTEFFERVVEEVRRNPRVSAAAFAQGLPFSNSIGRFVYAVYGQPVPPLAERPVAYGNVVSEEYFSTLGIPVKDGRVFDAHDTMETERVCIVNESLARRLFPNESAVGQRILRGQKADQPFRIVGVVGDVRALGLGAPVPDTLYIPLRQSPAPAPLFVARAIDGTPVDERTLRTAVERVSGSAAVAAYLTLSARTARSLGVERITSLVTQAFALVALALAALGIYGVVSYSVAQRTAELAVRVALGASQGLVMRMLLHEAMARVVVGLSLGIAAAYLGRTSLAAVIAGTGPADLRVVVVSGGILLAVSIVACLAPARRAARVNPARAMQGG